MPHQTLFLSFGYQKDPEGHFDLSGVSLLVAVVFQSCPLVFLFVLLLIPFHRTSVYLFPTFSSLGPFASSLIDSEAHGTHLDASAHKTVCTQHVQDHRSCSQGDSSVSQGCSLGSWAKPFAGELCNFAGGKGGSLAAIRARVLRFRRGALWVCTATLDVSSAPVCFRVTRGSVLS